ncbi:hypothetical protein N7466_004338 [Penicillium verhagenii]|uniref:uncharacterized protein n=1 Tax=Penicillium verhagenii TaxID=1562060 RepID=UPI002545206B|nr:uncharacterized protein N7466_004338 [Penicillium verhagenii]KAJ5934791.1 hypothetical protein N7466_004338 [Penicillium verhagenii]
MRFSQGIKAAALYAPAVTAIATGQTTTKIQAPATVSVDASQIVAHDFASFSIPIHFFADYAGNKSSPNEFSRDIIELLHKKTGAYPHIRVGGTSADRAIYNASQTESIILSSEYDNGIPLEVYIGPTLFEGFESFPGVPWTFQVNLANNKSDALDNALAEARVALSHIRENLVAFEVGNEPDLYPGAVRPLDFSTADYVREWTYFADAISNEVLRGNSYGLDYWRIFQALTFVFKGDGFSAAKAFNDGIDDTGHVKTVSLHQYASGNQAWVRLQNSFMNHTAIAGNLTQYIPDMEATYAADPSIEFLLGETNSDYINLDMAQVEGVFGSSLWLLDYLLYGMSMGISRFNLIQGTTFGYAAWVPVENNGQRPGVRPPLYGQLVAADVIGRHNKVHVKSLDLGLWDLSAYAVYESGVLARYVVINLDEWNATTSYVRPTRKVSLSVPRGVIWGEITKLSGPGASSDTGITWGGHSWNYTTHGRLGQFGKKQSTLVYPRSGLLNLDIFSTEAIVVELQR